MGLRICHILSGDLWAGAEVMACNLIKGLSRQEKSNDLCVVLLNYGRLERELRQVGIDVYVIDEQRNPFGRLLVAFRNIVAEFRPDIIHSHRYKENLLAMAAGFFAGKLPVVATQHGMPENYGGKQSLYRRIFQRTLTGIQGKSLHRIVAVSDDLRENLIKKLGFDRSKIAVIHNGIELPPLKEIFSGKASYDFGTAGRLFPVKDYPFMVEIAAAVIEKNNRATFAIAGEGPQKEMLTNKIDSLELGQHFKLLGHMDDMPNFYQSIGTYMNTSIHEGIPMSILEAMSFGRPVIAPQTGGIKEIVRDGQDGYLIEKRGVRDFCRRCLQLAGDAELAVRMGRSARQRVEEAFSIDIMTQRYMSLYLEIIKNRSTSHVNFS